MISGSKYANSNRRMVAVSAHPDWGIYGGLVWSPFGAGVACTAASGTAGALSLPLRDMHPGATPQLRRISNPRGSAMPFAGAWVLIWGGPGGNATGLLANHPGRGRVGCVVVPTSQTNNYKHRNVLAR